MENDSTLEAPVEQTTLTQRYTRRAVEFIRSNRERPFLLYLPHTFPHTPTYSSEDFDGKSPHGYFADAVEEIDWSTGRILDTLSELGLDDRTLVLFTSDNGPTRGRRGGAERWKGGSPGPLRGWKGTTWEGGMRVPAVFRWPGRIPAGLEIGELASILDIYPTVAELAGLRLPSDRVMDGCSLSDMLQGQADPSDDRLFCYYFGEQLQAVRQGHWKLVLQIKRYPRYPLSLWYVNNEKLFQRHYRLQPRAELYDLSKDIGEKVDLADKRPEVVRKLERLAREFDRKLQADKREPVFLEAGAQLPGG